MIKYTNISLYGYKLVDDNLTDILYNEKKIQIYGKI